MDYFSPGSKPHHKMTTFQSNQLEEIRNERRQAAAKFQATKAIAEIGICSEISGVYTINTLNGARKANWEAVEFQSEIEAVVSYARANFENGKLKRNGKGRYLVF